MEIKKQLWECTGNVNQIFKLEISKKRRELQVKPCHNWLEFNERNVQSTKCQYLKVKMSLINDKLVLVKKLEKNRHTHIHTHHFHFQARRSMGTRHTILWNTQIITEKNTSKNGFRKMDIKHWRTRIPWELANKQVEPYYCPIILSLVSTPGLRERRIRQGGRLPGTRRCCWKTKKQKEDREFAEYSIREDRAALKENFRDLWKIPSQVCSIPNRMNVKKLVETRWWSTWET